MASEHAKKLREVAAQLSTERVQGWANPLVGVITDAADFIDGTVTADTGDAVLSRPAPAATDTGLETVAENLARTFWGYFEGGPDAIAWFNNNKSLGGPAWLIKQCRSQAEELLAAERAEKEELDAECRVLAKRCIEKDARIKELEKINAVLMGDDNVGLDCQERLAR